MLGKTTIIISHDPGLIRCADRIMVIADGRIAESGQHADLIGAGGLYAELYLRELDHGTPDASGNGSDLGAGTEGPNGNESEFVTVARTGTRWMMFSRRDGHGHCLRHTRGNA